MKLKVFACLSEDINNGWVWVPEKLVHERVVVRIKNIYTGKSIYCEALQIGENFLKRYNRRYRTLRITDKNNSIVMNEWYRKKLEINGTQIEVEFDIFTCNNVWGSMRASLLNPQIVVRLATKLGLLSVILGVIGMYLSLKCK